jgi:tetratricopeptide (TPR) repeat protein
LNNDPATNQKVIESAETLRDKGQAKAVIELLSPVLANETGDISQKIRARIILSKALLDVGRVSEAIDIAKVARDLAENENDEKSSAEANLVLAFLYLQSYQSEEGIKLTESVLPKAMEHGWLDIEAHALALKAHFAELRRDYHPALAFFQQALEQAKGALNIKRQVTILSDIGRVQAILGNYVAAFDSLRESSQKAEDASLSRNMLINRYRKALIRMSIGELDRGKQELEAVEQESTALSLVDPQFSSLHQLGVYHLRKREYDLALKYLLRAKEVALSAGLNRHNIYSTLDLAGLYRETNRRREAIQELIEVWQAMQPLHSGHFEAIPQFLRELAALLPYPGNEELGGQADKGEQVASSTGIYEDSSKKRISQDEYLADLRIVVEKAFALAKVPDSLKGMKLTARGKKRARRFKYQVALSFAGEDRTDAEKLAQQMKAKGIRVFYDELEQANLWGKNLYEHLDHVYRVQAKYCLMLLSKYYAKKQWTNHERRSAQARAFEENEEYILPVRLDDTEIPGVLPTVGYLDLRAVSHDQVVERVVQKLAQRPRRGERT